MNCLTSLPLESATDSSSSTSDLAYDADSESEVSRDPPHQNFAMVEKQEQVHILDQRISREISSRSNTFSDFCYYNPRFIRTNFYLLYS